MKKCAQIFIFDFDFDLGSNLICLIFVIRIHDHDCTVADNKSVALFYNKHLEKCSKCYRYLFFQKKFKMSHLRTNLSTEISKKILKTVLQNLKK